MPLPAADATLRPIVSTFVQGLAPPATGLNVPDINFPGERVGDMDRHLHPPDDLKGRSEPRRRP